MDIQIIKNKLFENHDSFIEFVFSLPDDEFLKSTNHKWTPGQQLQHVYFSVKPVRQILTVPKFLLKLILRKTNIESRSYEELVKKYTLKLENGGRATTRFIPKKVNLEKGQQLKIKLNHEIDDLCCKLDKFNENELDTYILPHPLLGKVTIREMLYFTIYHVEHHKALTKKI